jgi:hypothetical protein
MSGASLDSRSRLLEWDAFRPFTDFFDHILTYPPAAMRRMDVRRMVRAGRVVPKFDKISKHRRDPFLLVNSSLESDRRYRTQFTGEI